MSQKRKTTSKKKTKKKKSSPGRNLSTAQKIFLDMTKFMSRKVFDIQEMRDAKLKSEEFEKTIALDTTLAGHDPLHAVYVYAHNKFDFILELIYDHPALNHLKKVGYDADKLYLPQGPPMSPLTNSYFASWCYFDLQAGPKQESFGSIVIELCQKLGADPGLLHILKIMAASRMCLYLHEGARGKYVFLREFITNEQIKAVVPAGYKGRKGEIWLTRVYPEPYPELNMGYSVAFTTPYVIGREEGKKFYKIGNKAEWDAYFERTLPKTGKSDPLEAYHHLMKYGLELHYWSEYIFEAFVNYIPEAIFLCGYPDIALSRPHSREREGW